VQPPASVRLESVGGGISFGCAVGKLGRPRARSYMWSVSRLPREPCSALQFAVAHRVSSQFRLSQQSQSPPFGDHSATPTRHEEVRVARRPARLPTTYPRHRNHRAGGIADCSRKFLIFRAGERGLARTADQSMMCMPTAAPSPREQHGGPASPMRGRRKCIICILRTR
jgi:hypothetical protein